MILQQQTAYNDTIQLGPYPGESISQSFFFNERFDLNAVYVLTDNVVNDPVSDVEIRCEVRLASGDYNLLDMDDTPVATSNWIYDALIYPYKYKQIWISASNLAAGYYYFSFVSNARVKYPFYFSIQNTGSFTGNFLKISEETGIYYNTKSLALKVAGEWKIADGYSNRDVESEIYMATTIRDLS